MRQPVRETGRLVAVVRTCIGCRQRSDKTALVRVVAVRESTTVVVTPDPRGTLPGRGAHLHPTTRCLELATRRKAFGRALRVEGPLDLSGLAAVVEGPGSDE
ncbi:YlxR family protein [Aeromicrobium wangtongii]|uniref:YlxR family protein n=1 Tax=Aeromicrobium wangtongii TaxID=2969247 RepID=A0ABY5M644_9ACTN|nr:YlxR family protein [Aeromicrobium wangtongii]MCD9198439.1 YlxR family protein [Aeromicrobium wangtongii]MCL3818876.1 YlxR family protein [Aeromicrobium wangtongii]UUP12468.1 YlxR family protein [Aeromicrobium wangtongii]